MNVERLLLRVSRVADSQIRRGGRQALRARRASWLLSCVRVKCALDPHAGDVVKTLLRAQALLWREMAGYRRAHRARLRAEVRKRPSLESIRRALGASPSQAIAAKRLGVDRVTLYRWRRELGIVAEYRVQHRPMYRPAGDPAQKRKWVRTTR